MERDLIYICFQRVSWNTCDTQKLMISFNIKNKSLYSAAAFLSIFNYGFQIQYLKENYKSNGEK